MAKEVNVHCNFLENNLTCVLPEHTMDVLLKVQTRSDEHTFWEDVYTRTLKYRRWNNELRPFCSLKKRVANMFCKRNSFLDGSRGTSTQTLVNNVGNNTDEYEVGMIDNESETDSDRNSVQSNWSELIPIKDGINKNTSTSDGEVVKINIQPRKRAIKNIVLVPYRLKPKDWGSWRVKSPYASSTFASPPILNDQNQDKEMIYVPHSPYYSPAHPTESYGDE